MAFVQEQAKQPVAIGDISISLTDKVAVNEEEPAVKQGSYTITVLFDDETSTKRRGNLVPHLEPDEITALMGFMDTLRARAESQILPPET